MCMCVWVVTTILEPTANHLQVSNPYPQYSQPTKTKQQFRLQR